MEALGLSSGAAGLISLGITVCQGLLDYYHSWKDAEDQVAHMYVSIESLTETFRLLESAIEPELFSRGSVQRVEESIRSAERGLQSLRKKLDKIRLVSVPPELGWKAKGMAQFRRTLFPFKESTLAKLKELGIELRQNLMLALEVLQIEGSTASLQKLDLLIHDLTKVSVNVDILQERSTFISRNVQSIEASSRQTHKSVDGLIMTQNNEFRRKVYDWLSPLTVEFQKKHLDTFNTQGRQDAAAQSLLETTQFRHWLSETGETLWCPGIRESNLALILVTPASLYRSNMLTPTEGTGKTVFASYVINHLQGTLDQTDTHLTYFYLSYKDAEKQSIPNLLTSLICQLTFSQPALLIELTASYEAHGSGATRPSHAECTQLLRTVASRCAKVFLVIDAFDEYPEEYRHQLVEELQNLEPKVNMMITSRDLPTIERQLSEAARLDVQARNDDILGYLRGRIASSERLKSHVKKDPTLCNLISTSIASSAGAMFLQARLHLDFLTTKTTLRKMKDALKCLPEGLNDTYDETMKRIDSQHPDHATLARKALYWIFYAFRPLTVLELQHALAVETGDSSLDCDNIPEEELLLSVCNGLVEYKKEGGFLALVHYTFQQYLEQKAGKIFPEAQVEIVRTCLTYLSFDEFEQGPCHEDEDFMVRLKRWPLISYAVPKWGRHACQGAEEACKDLIISFLSQSAKVSASIQVLWIKESTGVNYTRRFPSDVSALWVAALYELEYTVCQLLPSQRDSVGKKTTWGDTALHRASIGKSGQSVGILEMLLKHGADSSAKDRAGNTPLHVAVLVWHSKTFAFYELTKDQVQRDAISRLSDISLRIAQSLLDHGADVNAVNLNGETALHLSVKQGRHSLTQLFLRRGGDIALKDRLRTSPLALASKYGYKENARLLLTHGLQRQIQCGILDDAKRIAAFTGRIPLLEMMLAKSSGQSRPDPEGRNLLHISAYGGRLKCLQYLEKCGFDLGALDEQKRTCLHHSAAGASAGCCAVVGYLLEKGLDPNQSDVDGWTPLLWAAKSGNITNIQALLDAGADSFYQGDQEWIPFAIATYHENPHAAAILRSSKTPLPMMLQTQQSRLILRHQYILCDGCELTIFGSRYKCSECPDFDYCFKCVLSAEITHPSHHFDFIYWVDGNQELQRLERQEVMEELATRETFMLSWRA